MQKKFITVLTVLALFFAGCGEKKNDHEDHNLNDDRTTTQDTNKTNDNIIRTGVIDVAAIDENKDANVYQCPMDWNVVSDNTGTCPVCNMNLEQYSVDEAKDNLVRNDFEVK